MYTSIEFTTAWDEWKQHKAEKHGNPYTPTSEEKALARLWQQSHGIESLAISSINESIANDWAKIYIISNNKFNGSGTTNGGASTNGAGGASRGTSTDRMEAARKW